MVVNTGMASSSASSRRASVAPAASTPAPAQIRGRSAASRALTAASTSPREGSWRTGAGGS